MELANFRFEYWNDPFDDSLLQVEASMKNLETVVRERNRAYHTLETGVDGEQPGYMRENVFGLPEFYKWTLVPIQFPFAIPSIKRCELIHIFISLTVRRNTPNQAKVKSRLPYMRAMWLNFWHCTVNRIGISCERRESKQIQIKFRFVLRSSSQILSLLNTSCSKWREIVLDLLTKCNGSWFMQSNYPFEMGKRFARIWNGKRNIDSNAMSSFIYFQSKSQSRHDVNASLPEPWSWDVEKEVSRRRSW